MAHSTCWPCGLGSGLDSCQLREVVTSSSGTMVQSTGRALGRKPGTVIQGGKVCVRYILLQHNRNKLGSCYSVILTLETI